MPTRAGGARPPPHTGTSSSRTAPLPPPLPPIHAHSLLATLAAAGAVSLAALAPSAAALPGPPRLNLIEDPLDISNELPHDYRNWASVLSQVRGGGEREMRERERERGRAGVLSLSVLPTPPPPSIPSPPVLSPPLRPPPIPPQVLLKKEGSEEDATNALGRVMLAAHGHLAKVANGEELFPRFHLADPIFAGEGPADGLKGAVDDVAAHLVGKVKGKSVPTTITKFAAGKSFFNFAPCVLSETPVRGG